MREIKFRAWDKYNCKMFFPFKMKWTNDGIYTSKSRSYPFDDITLIPNQCEIMQYTGLKDKTNKDIYENDICKAWHPDNSNLLIGFIKWDNEQSSYFLNRGKFIGLPLFHFDDFEIIGNIYENPDKI